MVKAPKKLIETSIPLKDINEEAAREKSIRHGHPSTLHLWWARRPLAAARAVLFAQLVNAPKTKKKKDELFKLIAELVKWENSNNEDILSRARKEIMDSWRETCALNGNDKSKGFDPGQLPGVHDPFSGGGAIPLEAQRLGLESFASDLNPVAVMIEKAMIEIPPRFSGIHPIGPIPAGETKGKKREWPGSTGLAEDIRRYGLWMREEAKKRIGHLYPQVEVTEEMAEGRPDIKSYVGRKLTVVAWIWARTVPSPDPRFSHVRIPLVSSFLLSSKKGKEVWIEPIVEGDSYHFTIRTGKPSEEAASGTKLGRGKFKCLLSGMPLDEDAVRTAFKTGQTSETLMAIVCEGDKGRVYFPPDAGHVQAASVSLPDTLPVQKLPKQALGFRVQNYGMNEWWQLFTPRQLVALDTFSNLVQEVREAVVSAARSAECLPDDDRALSDGGSGPRAYADALAVYLAFAVDRAADAWSSLVGWRTSVEASRNTFARQALPMVWDHTETNPFSDSCGNWMGVSIEWIFNSILELPHNAGFARAVNADAQTQTISDNKIISTDPPYYDNIGYADLSDFFYVWMRRNLRDVFPSLFATMSVPKAEELVATPYRHGGVAAAEEFFLDGMTATMHNLAERAHPAFPVTIYYAFKQSETNDTGTSNAGWETFLEALIRAGFTITGTWPMSTEKTGRMRDNGSNALASSIVLVCRKRNPDAPTIGRGAFLSELREAMPKALDEMKEGTDNISPVNPVDIPQAAIGPGMEVFSKYAAVTKADGSAMSVHEAIIEINKFGPGTNGADPATCFCQDWLTEHGWNEGPFGDANTLAQARGTSVDHIAASGVLVSKGGKVRLLRPAEYPTEYDPATDKNRPIWEACHHLIRAFSTGGKRAAAALLAKMPEVENDVRDLCYSLYPLCERKGWADDARAYNQLMTAWPDILDAAATEKPPEPQGPRQTTMDFDS